MGSTFGKETIHKGLWNMVDTNWTLDAWRQNVRLFFKNHPSHQTGSRHWSVVSCVRCGCVGAGLGFPVGASAPLLLTPPTSDFDISEMLISKIKLFRYDVCNKCSVTWRELFKNSENPIVMLICLKCEFRNSSYFFRRMQKMLPHADGKLIWAYVYCGFWDREIMFVKDTMKL